LGGGGNDAVKSTNINEIQILSAGYQKPAKTVKSYPTYIVYKYKNRTHHHLEGDMRGNVANT
jgi:hypothetical protein